MSDDSFIPSSPSTAFSLALDWEQSQHKQEAREAREAELTPQEREEEAEERRRKRVRFNGESPRPGDSSPLLRKRRRFIEKSLGWSSPSQTPRPSALQSTEKTSSYYLPLGYLDSQADSQDVVNALIANQPQGHSPEMHTPPRRVYDFTSQDVLDQLDHRLQPPVYDDDDLSQELDLNLELRAQLLQAEEERDTAFDQLRAAESACAEAISDKLRAEAELARWKQAAESAAPLVALAASCINT
ncbi:hypothetical protein R3P38DRAFT_3069418 [Favolaschia claudopus]|uniref:Uncharacterized protein n=1 Tax=Favolaschia claudopus TaxID=2862362 RepID=A0AAW0A125_9AGAR